MSRYLLWFPVVLFIFSCQEEVKKKPVVVEPEWTQINLESDFQSISRETFEEKYHKFKNEEVNFESILDE